MAADRPQVLLAGRGFAPGSQFVERLGHSGCSCQVVHSFEELRRALAVREFDFVFSEIALPDGSAYPLLQQLEGSRTTLYFFVGVSDGCWWLPALAVGQRVWGEPALRPPEFARALESLLGDLEPAAGTADPASNVIALPPAEFSPPTPPQAANLAKTPARKSTA
jgi:hypothetical protein